jgi:hypothetical protein
LITQKKGRTQDDTVKLVGTAADEHGGRVDEMVVEGELRKFILEDARDDGAPEPARGEDVGLVDRVYGQRRVDGEGEVTGDTGYPLDFGDGVVASIPGGSRRGVGARQVGLLALAKVDAADELAKNDNIGALGEFLLERRMLEQRVGGEEGGPDVGVEVEVLAKGENALLRSHLARPPLWAADGA